MLSKGREYFVPFFFFFGYLMHISRVQIFLKSQLAAEVQVRTDWPPAVLTISWMGRLAPGCLSNVLSFIRNKTLQCQQHNQIDPSCSDRRGSIKSANPFHIWNLGKVIGRGSWKSHHQPILELLLCISDTGPQ